MRSQPPYHKIPLKGPALVKKVLEELGYLVSKPEGSSSPNFHCAKGSERFYVVVGGSSFSLSRVATVIELLTQGNEVRLAQPWGTVVRISRLGPGFTVEEIEEINVEDYLDTSVRVILPPGEFKKLTEIAEREHATIYSLVGRALSEKYGVKAGVGYG